MTMCKNVHRLLCETMIKHTIKWNKSFFVLLFSIPFVWIAFLVLLTKFTFLLCLFVVLSGWMPIIFYLFLSYGIFRAKSVQNGSIYSLSCTWYFHNMFVGSFIFCSALVYEISFSPPSLIFSFFLSIEKWLKCNLYLSLPRMDQLSVKVQHFQRNMGTNCKTNEISTMNNRRTPVWEIERRSSTVLLLCLTEPPSVCYFQKVCLRWRQNWRRRRHDEMVAT